MLLRVKQYDVSTITTIVYLVTLIQRADYVAGVRNQEELAVC